MEYTSFVQHHYSSQAPDIKFGNGSVVQKITCPKCVKKCHRWQCELGISIVVKEICQRCIVSVLVQHVVDTNSNVAIQGTVSQHHSSVMMVMIVEIGRMKTAVSNISIMACIIIQMFF